LVHFATDYQNGVFDGSFKNNTFITQPGLLTTYNVMFEGLIGTGCVFSGWDISGNRFGTPLQVDTAVVVDVDILVQNCAFKNSRIRNNTHYAQTNVTRAKGISGVTLSDNSGLDIGDNLFQQDGGTITDHYYSMLYPTRRSGSVTFNPGPIAPGGSTSIDIPVFNSIVGEYVSVAFKQSWQGLLVFAYVRINGTVTVQVFNPSTSTTVTLTPDDLSVMVTRTSVAEFDPS
jgi:hypothetical protein